MGRISNKPVELGIRLFLVLITLIVFCQVSSFEFLNVDDGIYVYKNPHIKDGFTAKSVRWAFTADLTHSTPNAEYWQPVTFLSRMLDIELFGLNPAGHHLMNLAFHVVNVLLLFELLRRTTHDPWKSGFVAAVFAVHPLQVESVAWVTERKDVLSTCLGLLTLLTYVGYVSRPKQVLRTRSYGMEKRPWHWRSAPVN